MKTLIKRTVLLAVLATAPFCTSAQANPWYTLGMGWWIIPVAAGGVVAFEVAHNQIDSDQQATYVKPQASYAQQRNVQAQDMYALPTPVYYQDQQTTYYQQQYGYVLATPGTE